MNTAEKEAYFKHVKALSEMAIELNKQKETIKILKICAQVLTDALEKIEVYPEGNYPIALIAKKALAAYRELTGDDL